MCWTGGGEQEGLTENLFLVGPSTVRNDDEDERGEKKEMQTDGGGAHEEEDEQDRQWEGVSERKRGIINCRENLAIQPAEVKGMREKKMLALLFLLSGCLHFAVSVKWKK